MLPLTATGLVALLTLPGQLAAAEYNPPSSYVAPAATGDGWPQAYAKAKAIVSKMTLQEKLNLTVWGSGVPRLGFPGYATADGSNGPAGTFLNHSSFASSITLAASLDRDLMYQRGYLSGQQLKKKGYNGLLGPNCNMMRSPEAGRNFENYGPEPFLTAEAMVSTVTGVQDAGTFVVTKHFIANEQEHGRQLQNSIIDDKTFHEIYEWPFAAAVHAGSAAIMCSYNLVNGTYACGNPQTLGKTLKGDLDFQGAVVSDYMADRLGARGFRAGLDSQLGESSFLLPPGAGTIGGFNLGQNLTQWINNGSITLDRVNDAAVRLMSPWYLLKQDQVKYPSLPNNIVTDNSEAAAYIRKAGAASTVLLKNSGGILPLSKPKSIAVFGIDAGSQANPNADGEGYQVAPGVFIPIANTGGGINGTLASGWGSAFNAFPYLVSPDAALSAKAKADGTSYTYVRDPYNTPAITAAASKASVCMVFISSDSGEEIDANDGNIGDRNNLTSWFNGDSLVKTVSSSCKNTVVIAHAVGPMLMDWADNDNVKAIVFAGLPGQESGNSLVDVVYGSYNPSAKLPFTIAYKQADYPASVDFSINNFQGKFADIEYTEGVFLDYRHFDAQGITPRYPFGYGLSYTSFSYSGISVKSTGSSRVRRNNGSKVIPGGPASLYDQVYKVTVTVKNSGKVDGNATPQLYIGFPSGYGEPPKVMRGFEKVMLKAGQSQQVTFCLKRKDISIWDVKSQSWIIPSGKISVYVGESSRDIKLTTSL